jgi:hypothetical protein
MANHPHEPRMPLNTNWESVIAHRDAAYQAATTGYSTHCVVDNGMWIQKHGQSGYLCIQDSAADLSDDEDKEEAQSEPDHTPAQSPRRSWFAKFKHTTEVKYNKAFNEERDTLDQVRRNRGLEACDLEPLRAGKHSCVVDRKVVVPLGLQKNEDWKKEQRRKVNEERLREQALQFEKYRLRISSAPDPPTEFGDRRSCVAVYPKGNFGQKKTVRWVDGEGAAKSLEKHRVDAGGQAELGDEWVKLWGW